MNTQEKTMLTALAGDQKICSGTVAEVTRSGGILVEQAGDPRRRVLCDFLQTSDQPALDLQPGDRVLLLLPDHPGQNGCVLGRVGPYVRPDRDHVVVEAGQSLMIRCGESTVEMRKNGKILSKANEIASIAKRGQRIKGGSVQIN